MVPGNFMHWTQLTVLDFPVLLERNPIYTRLLFANLDHVIILGAGGVVVDCELHMITRVVERQPRESGSV